MLKKAIAILRTCVSVVALVGAVFAVFDLPSAYRLERALQDTDQVVFDWLWVTGGFAVWFWLSGRRTKLFAKLSREYNNWVER